MKKLIIPIMLIVILMVAFAGCTRDDNTQTTPVPTIPMTPTVRVSPTLTPDTSPVLPGITPGIGDEPPGISPGIGDDLTESPANGNTVP